MIKELVVDWLCGIISWHAYESFELDHANTSKAPLMLRLAGTEKMVNALVENRLRFLQPTH